MKETRKDTGQQTESDHLTSKEALKVAVISIIIAYILVNFIIVNAIVPSGSMENTLNIGDRIIADRNLYKISGIQRGDIIIFNPPDSESNKIYYVKRVIGLPGETIEGKDGYVYINGEKLEENYVKEKLSSDFGPYTIPEDSYFMMGDNRNNSNDSRYWDNKFVSSSKITGKVVFRYVGGFTIFKTPEY